jgi:hypothetical protein
MMAGPNGRIICGGAKKLRKCLRLLPLKLAAVSDKSFQSELYLGSIALV